MSIILGIDYGDKRIGLSLSDPEEKLARRFYTLINEGEEKVLEAIIEEIEKENIEKVVIGLPLGFSGESDQTRKVEKFIGILGENVTIPIIKVNEVLTSKMAQENLLNAGVKDIKGILDQEAARIILQDYLDMKNIRGIERD